MTKRVTPATTTAIGVITVTLLAAGGSRLLTPVSVAAADTAGYSATLDKTTLPPGGSPPQTAQLTLAYPASCGGTLAGLGAGSVTVSSDRGVGLTGASGSGPSLTFTPSQTGQSVLTVTPTATGGMAIITATFTPATGLLAQPCSGTASAQLFEVGAPASVVLDPLPANTRLHIAATPAQTVHLVAHVLDASQSPIPGEKQVYMVRSGDPGNPVLMAETPAGSGNYAADLGPAGAPMSETLTAVDVVATGNLSSPTQTLLSVSSDADCAHTGMTFTPAGLIADGQSSSTAKATFFTGSAAAASEPVVFTADPGLNVTGASAATDAGGVATALVHAGYSIGTKKVTVTDPKSMASCSQMLGITNGTAGVKDSGQTSRFIYRAYNDVLHRKGEDAGVEYYGNFVNFGGSRGQVALAFTTTTEYLTNLVNGMYQKYLGRPGETDGVNYWVGQLENGGTTDEQLAALFLSSDEFYAQHSGTDSGFLDGLYQAVLGRAADADGKNSWLAAMQNGWTRTQVAYFFTGSTEQLSQKVVGYYSTFLNRGPNSVDDVNYWVNAMQHGVHDENVMAAFIGSQEYFDQS
jgi:hypothetical protein